MNYHKIIRIITRILSSLLFFTSEIEIYYFGIFRICSSNYYDYKAVERVNDLLHHNNVINMSYVIIISDYWILLDTVNQMIVKVPRLYSLHAMNLDLSLLLLIVHMIVWVFPNKNAYFENFLSDLFWRNKSVKY